MWYNQFVPRKESIYDTDKLSRFFGVSKKTIWGWCKHGKLPGFKIGKQWKVRLADMQKMIDRKVKVNKKEDSAQRLF